MEKIRYFALIFIVTRVALPVTCQTTYDSIESTTASTLTTTSQVTTESTSVTTIAVTTTGAAPPSAPTGLNIASKTTKSLEVTWQIASETIDSYIVQFKLKDASDSTFSVSHANLSSSDTSANITGLSPGQYYTVQVIATRSQLNSSAAEINKTTVPATPVLSPSPPVTTTTVQLTWTIEGKAESFHVAYSATSPVNGTNVTETVNQKQYNCTSLTPGTIYEIRVTAELEGSLSDPSILTVQTLPSPVTNITFPVELISTNSMRVVWSPGKGYTAEYEVSIDDVPSSNIVSSKASDTYRNITGLSPATSYTVSVVSKVGTKSSNPVERSQCTRQVAPTTTTTIVEVTNNFIEVSFKAYLHVSLLVDYLIGEVQNADNSTYYHKRARKSADSRTEIIFKNLTKGEVYNVTLYFEYCSLSSEPLVLTRDIVPSSPYNLEITPATTSIILSWDAGEGVVGGFYVIVNKWHGDIVFQEFTNVTTKTVTSLKPGMIYNVAVIATSRSLAKNTTELSEKVFTDPDKPIDVEVDGFFSDKISMWWKMGKGEINHFTVSVNSSENYMSPPIQVDGDGYSNYTVSKLEPGTLYEINITAVSNGRSSEPYILHNQTKPGTPGIIELGLQGSHSLVLKWQNSPGIVDRYNVTISPEEGIISAIQNEGDFSIVTVTGLTPGYTYKVSVKAETNSLYGDASETSVSTAEIPPSSPRNLTSDDTTENSTSLKWKEPQNPNGQITNYIIEYWKADHKTEEYGNIFLLYTNSTDTSYNVDNLTPGANYKFQVKAMNSNGTGEASNNITVRTNEAVPGEVYNLSVSQNTSMSMNIGWEEPIEPNGEVITYELHVLLEDESCVQQVTFSCTDCPAISKTSEKSEEAPSCTSTDTTQSFSIHGRVDYTVRNLVPYTNYTFRVYPFTSVGRGKSKDMREQTLEDTPSEPRNVSAVNTTQNENTGLNITWKAPANPRGIITRYQLRVTVNQARSSYNTTDEFKSLPDLLSYQIHTIEVRAYTVAGPGNWSKPLTALTGEAPPSEPRNVSAVNTTQNENTGLNITWEAPANPRGIITGYQLRVTVNQASNFYNATDEFIALPDLLSYQNHTIEIRAYTVAGPGNWSKPLTVLTGEARPSAPQHIAFGDISPTSIEVQWQDPVMKRGILVDYLITVTKASNLEVVKNETQDANEAKSFNATGLDPCRKYTFKVAARTSKGFGNYSSEQTNSTAVNIPGTPVIVKAEATTSTSILVMWTPPPNETCLIDYVVEMTESDGQNSVKELIKGYQSTEKNITGLKKYWSYDIKVKANNTAGPSMPSPLITKRTLEDTPGPPARVNASCDVCYNNMTVTWEAPTRENKHGLITGYVIYYISTDGEISKNKEISGSQNSSTITSLSAEKSYQVKVAARTSVGEGENKTAPTNVKLTSGPPIIIDTLANTFAEVSTASVNDARKQISLKVRSSPFGSENGIVRNISIIVAEDSEAGKPESDVRKDNKFPTLKTWGQVKDLEKITPYAIKEIEPNPWGTAGQRQRRAATQYEIIIGSQDCSNVATSKYCNGPLPSGRTYCIRIRGYTTNGYTDTPCVKQGTEPDTTGAIAGGVTAVLIVLIIAFVVLFIIAKRRGLIGGKSQRENTQRNPSTAGHDNEGFDGEELKSRSRPVSTSQFKEHVEKYHRDSDLLFSDEYKTVKELAASYEWLEAEKPSNRCKNRYTNILPFDHSRVKLLPIDDDEGSDYINANYMPGYRSKREFIAAQGPLPATKDDFWRMIWEQNVTLVVMVTQCVERGRIKCEQYWPKDTEAEYYGDLVVQMRSESTLSDYTIRILDVQLGNNTRTVRHFNFTVWPDFGCPDTTRSLLEFVKVVRTHIKPDIQGPICVHCSAGVGRTGTFIAVDRLLQHIREHNEVDIFGLVLEMRENRCNMVQTEDQYIYIHECIKDAIAQGMHLNNGNLEDQL